MKLCIVIAYYITSATKQLKFLHFHCSIVCSYCYAVCLIVKNELEMIEFSSSFKLNEIHIVAGGGGGGGATTGFAHESFDAGPGN